MNILNASNPSRNADGSIDLLVNFEEFNTEVPFTASPQDTTDYGKQLYINAIAGIYGTIN